MLDHVRRHGRRAHGVTDAAPFLARREALEERNVGAGRDGGLDVAHGVVEAGGLQRVGVRDD